MTEREMDAEIAEKVMEEKIWVCSWYPEWTDPWQCSSTVTFKTKIEAENHLSSVKKCKIPYWANHKVYRTFRLKHYSTKIEDAWLVVEKMFSKTAYTFDHCENYVKLVVAWKGDLITVEAETAPLAICKAALAAVTDGE